MCWLTTHATRANPPCTPHLGGDGHALVSGNAILLRHRPPSIHSDCPTNALLEAHHSMSPSDAVEGELFGVGATVAIQAEICRQPTARRPVSAHQPRPSETMCSPAGQIHFNDN